MNVFAICYNFYLLLNRIGLFSVRFNLAIGIFWQTLAILFFLQLQYFVNLLINLLNLVQPLLIFLGKSLPVDSAHEGLNIEKLILLHRDFLTLNVKKLDAFLSTFSITPIILRKCLYLSILSVELLKEILHVCLFALVFRLLLVLFELTHPLLVHTCVVFD